MPVSSAGTVGGIRGLLRIIVWVGAIYLLVVVGLFLIQNRLVFVGAARNRSVRVTPPAGVENYSLKLASGNTFRVALAHAKDPVALAVFFDGNGGGDLQSASYWADQLVGLQVSVLAIEYPGYADSEGTPGVAVFYEAAEKAVAEIRQRSATSVPVVAIGYSLGSFCALHLASKQLVDKAVLWAPPVSTMEIAKRSFWWVPLALVLRHKFDNLAHARTVTCPVMILHGDADRDVPIDHGRRLARALGTRCELVVVPGAGHNDPPLKAGSPYWQKIYNFLRGI